MELMDNSQITVLFTHQTQLFLTSGVFILDATWLQEESKKCT